MSCSTTAQCSLRSKHTCTCILCPAPPHFLCIVLPVEYCLPVRWQPLGFLYSDCFEKCSTARYDSRSSKIRVSSGDQVGCWWRDLVAEVLTATALWCSHVVTQVANCKPYHLAVEQAAASLAVIFMFCRADELSVAALAEVLPPCSGLKRSPSFDSRLCFFSSPPPCESVLPSNEIFRRAVCWSVWPWLTSCIIGWLFTSLVSLSLLRRLPVKKWAHSCCEIQLPHQTEILNA